jgi:hypothetical protein
MKPSYSKGLLLVWQVADLEAKRLHAAFLEPAHLLLGLCKCVDLDLPAAVHPGTPDRDALLEELLRDLQGLRSAFRVAGFDAMRFRRHYRAVLPEGSAGFNATSGRLHRTDASKDAFADAETVVQVVGGLVYPVHLLHSLLAECDPLRDKAMTDVGADANRLRQVVKQGLVVQQNAAVQGPHQENAQWN